jgi:hypothetical protein
MASRTPRLQLRSQYNPHWGEFATAADLPNTAGNPLSASALVLQPGDLAFVTGDGTYECVTAGAAAATPPAVWQKTGGGGGGPSHITGATYEETTLLGVEELVGGLVFNPAAYPSPSIILQLYGVLRIAQAGTGELRLYDMGAPGSPTPDLLVATAVLPNGSAGSNTRANVALTPVAVPAAPGEIYDAERMYELRLIMVGGILDTDSVLCLWGGIIVS